MLKMMNKKQKTTTNKGFSLVELIVVIAIMAVLVAVLAPAMLRYVENSRKSTDASTVEGVVSTAQATVISDNVAPGTYVITIKDSGCKVEKDDGTKLADSLEESYGAPASGVFKDVKLKSSTWKTGGVEVQIVVNDTGATTVKYFSAGKTGDDSFAKYIEATEADKTAVTENK
ncbi:type II secretion system protein [Roseburia sp. 499]|uniref:type II secretion system protein n=1 Tax=Roseburia sp. 499 TaxID=1261634 RepID=UPI000951E876|nr:type II secretion system protein [Roseburia sp. 499]WVK70652.1 type II secretion system protein [Roseburia sp. 499]